MKSRDARIEADYESISFDCPKCGCKLSCGVDWSNEYGGKWKCEECDAPFSISVLHMGYSFDIVFDDVTLEGSY